MQCIAGSSVWMSRQLVEERDRKRGGSDCTCITIITAVILVSGGNKMKTDKRR